ncbi:hypothetical protein ABZ747_37125 [Kitasatospora cineracea]|uniref:hypothetical protein n=1 Tax=Kitasatospora cineracea TaxID=88074 RepID=UPI0033E88B74
MRTHQPTAADQARKMVTASLLKAGLRPTSLHPHEPWRGRTTGFLVRGDEKALTVSRHPMPLDRGARDTYHRALYAGSVAADAAWQYEDGSEGSLVVRPGIWGWAGPMTTLGPLTALADEELERALTGEAFEIWADTATGRTVVPVGNSRTTTLDMLRRDLKKERRVAADAQGVITVDARDFRGDLYRVYVNAVPPHGSAACAWNAAAPGASTATSTSRCAATGSGADRPAAGTRPAAPPRLRGRGNEHPPPGGTEQPCPRRT